MSVIKLVLFDITGTIIKDTGDMVRAMIAALQKNGMAITEDDLRELRGAAKREVIRSFISRKAGREIDIKDPRVQAVDDDFRSILEAEFQSHPIVPIPGAEEAFRRLRGQGVLLGTTTGYHRKLGDIILSRLGWRETFQATVCSDEVALGRPAPYMIFRAMEMARVTSVAQVVTVGDTPLDLQAGTNAGVRGIVGVISGAHKAERLQREHHTHILSSVADVPEIMEEFATS